MPDGTHGIFGRVLRALQNVYVVWAIVLVDAILLLLTMLFHPQVFQYAWAKVLILVAAVKAVLVFIGIVENDRLKNPYKDLHEFLLNPFAWSAVLLFSAFFWAAIIYLQLNPTELCITLKSPKESGAIMPQTVYLEVHKVNAASQFATRVRVDTSTTVVIPNIDLYEVYNIAVTPGDSDAVTAESGSLLTIFGRNMKDIPLAARMHPVVFDISPPEASLSIDGRPAVGHAIRLPKGIHRYEVNALDFVGVKDSVDIPQGLTKPDGTIIVELRPKTVQATIFADRGIGKKRIPVDGIVTLYEGKSIFADSLRTGVPMHIPVGRIFKATVFAKSSWDLYSRTYYGEKPELAVRDSTQKIQIWIKVIEQF